jgi:hypothetical protein
VPAVRVEVANSACPFARAWVPSEVAPSRKLTVPVGVPVAGATGDTAAVKVTESPVSDGLAEDETTTDGAETWAGDAVCDPSVPAASASTMSCTAPTRWAVPAIVVWLIIALPFLRLLSLLRFLRVLRSLRVMKFLSVLRFLRVLRVLRFLRLLTFLKVLTFLRVMRFFRVLRFLRALRLLRFLRRPLQPLPWGSMEGVGAIGRGVASR